MGPHKMSCDACHTTVTVPADEAPLVRFYRLPDGWTERGGKVNCGCDTGAR